MSSIFKITIIVLVNFISSTVLCQKTNRENDWDKESLKFKPENITTISYNQIDKFGESQEEKFETRAISFNEYGLYTIISDDCEGFDPSPNTGNPTDFFYYNSTYRYTYQPNSACLSSIYWSKDNYSSKDIYNCNNGEISEVIRNTANTGGIENEIYKTKYTYDERGNNIKVELCIKDSRSYNYLILDCNRTWIIKYNSNNKKIEENLYDDKGYLEKINTYKYDTRGNLIEHIFQDGKIATSPSTHREITTNAYDSRNNIIKSQVIRYVGNNVGVIPDNYYSNSGTCCFVWYKNEYYPNNSIKKITKYRHYDSHVAGNGRIIPASENLQDVTEYKSYDEHGNWLEKIVYQDCYLEKKCDSRYTRYARTIQYFDSKRSDVTSTNNNVQINTHTPNPIDTIKSTESKKVTQVLDSNNLKKIWAELDIENEKIRYQNKEKLIQKRYLEDLKEITIGAQIWASKNLSVSYFRNGDKIVEAKTPEEWVNAGKEGIAAWCYYDNNDAYGLQYGKLYNWYAVNDPRGLAPSGWRVPTDEEWTMLTDDLGGSILAGNKLKTTTGWNNNNDGINTTSFSGLPGGYRLDDGTFDAIGIGGNWWCSKQINSKYAYARGLYYLSSNVGRGPNAKANGMSVRCIKD